MKLMLNQETEKKADKEQVAELVSNEEKDRREIGKLVERVREIEGVIHRTGMIEESPGIRGEGEEGSEEEMKSMREP